jgi:hypothetical protein
MREMENTRESREAGKKGKQEAEILEDNEYKEEAGRKQEEMLEKSRVNKAEAEEWE